MDCFNCGQKMTVSIEPHHYRECGLDNVYLANVKVYRCATCNEKVVRIPAIARLNDLIAEDLLKKGSLLNGKEIRFLRKNMGMKAIDLKEYLGVENETISRWESGKQKISPSHDRLLRLVFALIKGLSQEKTAILKSQLTQIRKVEDTTPLYQIDVNTLDATCLAAA